jgi:LEA14-like dessication related protein
MPSQRFTLILAVLLLAVVVLIAGSAGCISQPTVTVDDVRIGSLTPANTTLEVEIQITNPNSFDIPLKDVSFTISSVEAAGPRQLGAGATGPFTLAAKQTVNKTVLVTLDNRALLEAALAAVSARQTSMTFRVEGTVSGSVFGIVPVNVPFSYDRTVTLQQMLGMAGIQVGENEVRQVLGGVKTVVGGAIREIAGRIGG